MQKKIRTAITAIGHYFPDKVVTNFDFEKTLDTSDEWIRIRTGIVERRFLENGLATSDMAVKSIEMLLERRGIGAEEIDIILVGSVTPDMFFPSTACIIQEKIGARNAWGYDILAACSGFIFPMITGAMFIENGYAKKVLIVGSDKMTTIMDFEDRNTCVLFGDGAGSVLLEPTEEEEGIIDSVMYTDGAGGKYLYMPAGGSLNPATHETVEKRMHYIFQEGQAVFKDAVKGMADVSSLLMKRNSLNADDIAWLVPHQANLRIITSTASRMKLSMDKVMVNIDKYGNTTAATIPSCLSEYWAEGRIKKGDNLILVSFGAGYTWGGILLKWAY